ncbi:MAG: helix-turn-helix domain-containing protein [Stackebrandtia sp.]
MIQNGSQPPEAGERRGNGDAVRRLREHAKLGRQALAARAKMSESHLRNIENGHRTLTPDLAETLDKALSTDGMLLELANAGSDLLRRRTLLRGLATLAIPVRTGLSEVKEAFNAYPTFTDAAPNASLGNIRRGAVVAHRLYQAAEYEKAARLLPDLIAGVDALAAHDNSSRDIRTLRASTYIAAAKLATKLHDNSLAWLASDRAAAEARYNGDLLLSAGAAYQVACALLRTGHEDRAEHITTFMSEKTVDRSPLGLSMRGALTLLSAVIAARRADADETWERLAQAEALADRLGRDGNFGWTAFGPTNVRIHQVSAAVELGDAATAIAKAAELKTSSLPEGLRSRRARLHIDAAWAFHRKRRDNDAIEHLLDAEGSAPQALRCNPLACDLLQDMLRRERRDATPELRPLAKRCGIIP